MTNKCCSHTGNKLDSAIHDYLLWMRTCGYTLKTQILYKRILGYFSSFIHRNAVPWNSTFTVLTQQAFQEDIKITHISPPINGLGRYLFRTKKLTQPPQQQLPDIYEEYLCYFSKSRQAHHQHIQRIRRVLTFWHEWLVLQGLELFAICIENVDGFLAEYNPRFAPQTRQNNVSGN